MSRSPISQYLEDVLGVKSFIQPAGAKADPSGVQGVDFTAAAASSSQPSVRCLVLLQDGTRAKAMPLVSKMMAAIKQSDFTVLEESEWQLNRTAEKALVFGSLQAVSGLQASSVLVAEPIESYMGSGSAVQQNKKALWGRLQGFAKA